MPPTFSDLIIQISDLLQLEGLDEFGEGFFIESVFLSFHGDEEELVAHHERLAAEVASAVLDEEVDGGVAENLNEVSKDELVVWMVAYDAAEKSIEAGDFLAPLKRHGIGSDEKKKHPLILEGSDVDIVAEFMGAVGNGERLLDHLGRGGE